ncbi:protein of unknown function [Andreprevotia lacus DSM 23236]|jgi:hypothetical protein|uniref:DUF4157 domain-containing protein n=1 Tax=Andreprevotia lacus DSM 23236 TaxID=1121001 RepID=A0A1W1X702_9NEIS|nr:DUF4157 domain-containing protein [Andreprevotia lacus]SMC19726.1 protein of unknown function [Andreprevotia lacus DSM 23236]
MAGPAATRSHKVGGVQRKAPSVSRGARGDAHERQADRAAQGIARGELGLARGLTPASAAGFRQPGSRGEPLPLALRLRLEQAFGAGLNVLRIHRDAAAWSATAALGVRAFASGPSLYFAAGAYRPDLADGLALLGHETAHALQQTGRMDAAGHLSATAVWGGGNVQCEWASPLSSTDPVPALVDTLTLYRDAATAGSEERLLLERLLAQSAPATAAAYWSARAGHVNAQSVDPELPGSPATLNVLVASALYDGLKQQGHVAAAAALLQLRTDLQTTFFSGATYARYVEDRGGRFDDLKQRLYAHWYADSWFGLGNPRFMLDRTLVGLIGPSAVFSNQEVAAGDLVNTASAELLRRHAGTIGPDELHYVTVHVAAVIESSRRTLLQQAQENVMRLPQSATASRARIKRAVAVQLEQDCTRQLMAHAAASRRGPPAVGAGSSVEAERIWFEDVLPALRDMAHFAVAFWESADAMETSLGDGSALAGGDQPARALLAGIDTTLPGYRDQLAVFLHALLDRPATGVLPDPATFEATRNTAVRNLDRSMLSLVERRTADRLIDALPGNRAGHRAFAFDSAMAGRLIAQPERAVIAWALNFAAGLRLRAQQYQPAADTGMRAMQAAVQPGAAGTDILDIFRVRFANHALTVARRVGWDGWIDWADLIVQGRETAPGGGLTDDYVVFGSDWMIDAETGVQQMAADLPVAVRGFEPLRTSDLVDFYQAQDYRRLSEHIDRLLTANRASYTLAAEPVLNQAFSAARAEFTPVRYLIDDWEWVTPWVTENGERQRQPRRNLRELVQQHPLTQQLLAGVRARYPGQTIAHGVGRAADHDRFIPAIWIMPSPAALVSRLQALPAINQVLVTMLPALMAYLNALTASSSVPNVSQQSWQQLVRDIEAGRAYRPDAALSGPVQMATITATTLAGLQWGVWWELWRASLAIRTAPEQADLIEQLRTAMDAARLPQALRDEHRTGFDAALQAQRRALAHERRRRVEVQFRPALDRYEPRSMTRFRVPGQAGQTVVRLLVREVSTLLTQFVGSVDDRAEQEGHLAMAVFELADTLHAKLLSQQDMGDVHAWVPLVDTALFWAAQATGGASQTIRDSFTVAEERGNTTLFEQRRTQLRELLEHQVSVLQRAILDSGMVGEAGDGTLESTGTVRTQDSNRRIGRGQGFTIEGTTWEIQEVHANFAFHPGTFGLRSMPNAASVGSMLSLDGGRTHLADGNRPHVRLLSVMVNEGPEPLELYADSPQTIEVLTRLTWALYLRNTMEQLGELAGAIETFGGYMMDAAELFPGGGQALAATRLITATVAFFSGDGPEMIQHLITHPRELLERVWERTLGLLHFENLLQYLLFSNHSLNGLIGEPRAPGPQTIGNSSSARLRRLLLKVQNFARNIGRLFAGMEDHVQDRRQQVEGLVQSSPGLVRVVQLIADYYLIIAAMVDRLGGLEGRAEAVADFGSFISNLPQRLDEMIASLGELELPREILPLEDLINVLIDVIGHRLGGKYRLGVHILLQLLDFIGARQQLVSGVAGLLRDAGVTTDNLFPFWNDTIVPQVTARLTEAQSMMRNTLHTTFEQFGTPLGLSVPHAQVTTSNRGFPGETEAQPQLESAVAAGLSRQSQGGLGGTQAASLLDRVAAEPGEPLAPSTRGDVEQRFGQDFSHVRLHRGGRAQALTGAVGARALTAGSHVILGAGDAAAARPQLLYHELAHVVQQTGARQRGGSHPATPRRSRARRGIHWDGAAEAQADAAARAAMAGSARGIALGRADAGQPSMIELLGQRFLRQVTDITSIEEEVEEIDSTASTTGRSLIGRDVRRAVSHVAQDLRTRLRPGSSGLHTSAGTYRHVLDAISTHLMNHHEEIAEAIEDIAIRASYEAERARPGHPARMALDVRDFTRRLERYILGKTGILLDFDMPVRGRGQEATFRDAQHPYASAEVKFVYLAHVNGNTNLWHLALEHGTGPGGGQTNILPARRQELRPLIRAVLHDLGPSSSIWASNAYRFSHAIFRAAEELERQQQIAASAGTLPATALPAKSEYLNTTGTTQTAGYGNQRLHLGTFAQKDSGEQSGKERESHHITQYLLVEYFHNGASNGSEEPASKSAFPLLRRRLDAYGSELATNGARRPSMFRGIQIESLEAGRGGLMPTILLARPTHRRGNLHMNAAAEDFSDSGAVTQSEIVNHIFRQELPEPYLRLERAAVNNPRSSTHYDAWVAYRDRPANQVGNHIYQAMQKTYGYMRTHMQTQLKSALRGIELGYYNDLYLAHHPGTAANSSALIKPGEMNHIWSLAVAHNDKGMSARGWRG